MQLLEELWGELQYASSSFPDVRKGTPDNTEIADGGMTAFSVFLC
jgi:hypothetical protein